MTAQRPGEPTGAETLVSVLGEAAEAGYDTDLIIRDDATVECRACEARQPATDLTVDHVRRLEGASDVADMMLVALTTCARCGRKGAATLGYGPNAGPEDVAVLLALSLGGRDAAPPGG